MNTAARLDLDDLSHVLYSLAAIIAPARCIGCLQETTWLCPPCRIALRVAYRRWQNSRQPPAPASLTGLVSAGAYRTPALKRGIAWLKFKSVRPVAAVLAGLMLPALEQIRPLLQLPAEAVLVPLPLHQHRLAQRGFNQAEALTTALHQLTGIPVIPALTRQRPTIQQTQLPSSLRRHNIAHAFLSSFQIPNSQYQIALIIDDVTTTGATLAEAARTLREAGFTGTIYGATVARG